MMKHCFLKSVKNQDKSNITILCMCGTTTFCNQCDVAENLLRFELVKTSEDLHPMFRTFLHSESWDWSLLTVRHATGVSSAPLAPTFLEHLPRRSNPNPT